MNLNSATSQFRQIVAEILLLDDSEYDTALARDDVETWDSLAMVNLAVALHESFGIYMTPEEAEEVEKIADLVEFLKRNGVAL